MIRFRPPHSCTQCSLNQEEYSYEINERAGAAPAHNPPTPFGLEQVDKSHHLNELLNELREMITFRQETNTDILVLCKLHYLMG